MSGLRYYIGAGCDQTRLGGVKNSLTESYPSKGLLILKEPFPMLLKGPWLGTPSFGSVDIKLRSLVGGPNPVATRRIIILVALGSSSRDLLGSSVAGGLCQAKPLLLRGHFFDLNSLQTTRPHIFISYSLSTVICQPLTAVGVFYLPSTSAVSGWWAMSKLSRFGTCLSRKPTHTTLRVSVLRRASSHSSAAMKEPLNNSRPTTSYT